MRFKRLIGLLAVSSVALGTLSACGNQNSNQNNTASMSGEQHWTVAKKIAPHCTNRQLFSRNIIYNQDRSEIILQPNYKMRNQLKFAKSTQTRKRLYNIMWKYASNEQKFLDKKAKDKQIKVRLNN